MPEQGSPAGGQPQDGGTPATPQVGSGGGAPQQQNPPQDGSPAAQGTSTELDEGTLPEPVQEMLRNYRQENSSLRKRLKAQSPAAPAKPGEGDTDAAELQRTVAQQQERLRQGEVRYAVAVESARMGIVDPEAAYRLLDTEDIDFDSKTDKPTNVKEALTALVRERPWLRQTQQRGGSADGGAGGNRPPTVGMNDIIRRAAGRG